MKRFRLKQTSCLFLVAALLTASLAGCQASINPHASPGPDSTDSPETQGILLETFPTYWENGLDATPNDLLFSADLFWAGQMLHLPETWNITTGSPTVRVGIIDSGVDASHPDLANRINRSLSESFVPGVSALVDTLGHGTHVASIIGAQGNNGIGIAGVAWNVEIVSLRVLDDNDDIYMSAIIDAIESANAKGIHILNLSLHTILPAWQSEFAEAISSFNGLLVCSAGNISSGNNPVDPDDPANNDNNIVLPANLRMNNLLSVGASTHIDTLGTYSHYGATTVDIFAPGTSILGCYPVQKCRNATCTATTHIAEGYHLMTGTSMAAPFVAGVAALLLSIHPELTAAELKEIIMNNADLFDANGNRPFAGLCVSGGRLNAYKALSDPSIHTFGSWTDYSSTYHARACITCGYTQYNHHTTLGGEVCRICGHSGPITASISPVLLLATPGAQQTVLPKCA